jgi:hypothetical protein
MRYLCFLAVWIGCGPQESEWAVWSSGLTNEQLPAAGDLRIDPGVLGAGVTSDLSLEGAGPYEYIHVAIGLIEGDGPCFAALGGECLGMTESIRRLGSVYVDGEGNQTLSFTAPDRIGESVCFQAIAIRGPGAIYTELSPVVCRVIDGDSDGDGVPDTLDPCPDDPDDDCFDGTRLVPGNTDIAVSLEGMDGTGTMIFRCAEWEEEVCVDAQVMVPSTTCGDHMDSDSWLTSTFYNDPLNRICPLFCMGSTSGADPYYSVCEAGSASVDTARVSSGYSASETGCISSTDYRWRIDNDFQEDPPMFNIRLSDYGTTTPQLRVTCDGWE